MLPNSNPPDDANYEAAGGEQAAKPAVDTFTITPALFSLGARLNLGLPNKVLNDAVTHPSFGEARAYRHNSRLAFLGRAVLGCYVAEYFHMKYPNLPATAFNEAVGAYVSAASLGQFGIEVGLDKVVRWKRQSPHYDHEVYWSAAVGSAVAAFVGAIYDLKGPTAAKDFVHAHILSRHLDLAKVIIIPEPKRYFAALMKRQGRPTPESRLLKETGRASSSPSFLVGTFVDNEKVSEGFGSSISMAEQRSSYNAMLEHYTMEVKDFVLPSVTEEGKDYVPTKLGDTQVIP